MIFVVTLFLLLVQTEAWFPSYYPQYCTKDLSKRKIPPLTASQLTLVKELEQVQVIVRHGARTPYAKFSCWKDYDVTWNNCNVTELMLASPSMTDESRPAPWLFRKLYDGSPNFLGGNCFTGQLLSDGYTQEEAVGSSLLEAYLQNSNPALNLFNTSIWTDIDTDEEVYLRSDDEQRTLMSGQILMHTFFNITEEVIVPWHTGDYDLDQIYPNSEVCPRLDTLEDSIYATPGFVNENTSTEINQLTSQLNTIFGDGYWTWYNVWDCVMTTVCTSRPLPDGTAEVPMTEEIFNATLEQVQFTQAYLQLYNDSQWSKLAMGNTAWHVSSNLQNVLYNTNNSLNSSKTLRLAVFAGHDTTVMPFLASVLGVEWDGLWPGYASLVTIELYSGSAASSVPWLFRMVYNSDPLLVPGCDDYLCDATILLDKLGYGQQYMPCSVNPDTVVEDDDSGDCDNDRLSDGNVILIAFMSALFGGLLGAALILFSVKRAAKDPLLNSSHTTQPSSV
eukprot:gene8062-8892_t